MSAFTEADYALINLGVCIKAQADRLGIEHEGVPLEGVVVRIAARALAEQGETEWEYGIRSINEDIVPIISTMPTLESAQIRANNIRGGWIVVRRRKAGPWLPVPGSTVRESDSGVRDSDSEESEG